MTIPLKPCPCGQTPDRLVVTDGAGGYKWAFVSGDCCQEWHIEFRTNYKEPDSPECMALATDAWNGAPRAQLKEDT